jgi:hypothetical protein
MQYCLGESAKSIRRADKQEIYTSLVVFHPVSCHSFAASSRVAGRPALDGFFDGVFRNLHFDKMLGVVIGQRDCFLGQSFSVER